MLESWLEQLKKVTQSNAVKRGITLDRLLSVYTTGRSLEFDTEAELKPIKSTLIASVSWLQRNMMTLRQLGIISNNVQESSNSLYGQVICNKSILQHLRSSNKATNNNSQPTIDESAGSTAGIKEEDDKSESLQGPKENDQESMNLSDETPLELVSYASLHHTVSTGANLMMEFDEIRQVREMLSRVDAWHSHVQDALSNSFLSNTISRSSRHKSNTTGKGRRNDKLDPLQNIGNHCQLLELLLVKADELKVNVDSDKNKISTVLSISRQWDSQAIIKLNELYDSTELMIESILTSYKGTANEGESNAIVCPATTVYQFLRGIHADVNQLVISSNLENIDLTMKESVAPANKKMNAEIEVYVDEMSLICDELTNLLDEADTKGTH